MQKKSLLMSNIDPGIKIIFFKSILSVAHYGSETWTTGKPENRGIWNEVLPKDNENFVGQQVSEWKSFKIRQRKVKLVANCYTKS